MTLIVDSCNILSCFTFFFFFCKAPVMSPRPDNVTVAVAAHDHEALFTRVTCHLAQRVLYVRRVCH